MRRFLGKVGTIVLISCIMVSVKSISVCADNISAARAEEIALTAGNKPASDARAEEIALTASLTAARKAAADAARAEEIALTAARKAKA